MEGASLCSGSCLIPLSSTYSYLLADAESREAVLIDPVYEQARRDTALIRELGLTLRCTVESHVHADHVTAAWRLKQELGSQIVVGAHSEAQGADRYLAHGETHRLWLALHRRARHARPHRRMHHAGIG